MKKIILILLFLSIIISSKSFSTDYGIMIDDQILTYNYEHIRDYKIYYKGTLELLAWSGDLNFNNGKTFIEANSLYTKASNPAYQVYKLFYISPDTMKSWKRTEVCIWKDSARTKYYSYATPSLVLLPSGKIMLTTDTMGLVFESVDNGYTYTLRQLKGLEDKSLLRLAFKDDSVGIVTTKENEIYKTFDGGYNWKKILPVDPSIDSSKYFFSNLFYKDNGSKNKLLIAFLRINGRNKLYISNDDAESWNECSPFPNLYKTNISTAYPNIFCRNDSLWFITYYALGKNYASAPLHNTLYFTSNFGKTWDIQLYAQPKLPINSALNRILFYDNSLVGMMSSGATSPQLLVTFNGGKYWVNLHDTITSHETTNTSADKYFYVNIFKYQNDIYYINGNNQLYKFNLLSDLPVGVEENDKNVNNGKIFYNITSQNIEFKAESDEFYSSIRIFDLDGRELYKSYGGNQSNFSIQKNELQNAKVIFVVAQTNKSGYIKKLMLE
ncbi:MAG: hypothetical protein A2X64_06030 [Ignavibacteria bacterium GWF2_33_9]|nr:MAG: hypothetical protein A2X64_06030 [Ignavibacteria bacterium GWF2_33_9]